ncbi:hypothetical protein [Flammeovirga sp. SJP92]|uniref:hypothetical protein n=1 Tax=Flammeovirga sp. SJP92 TaxID=1775430 RepID=UPI00078966A6|nr:hypothetical protein [Flammeovirga sp. SJP92]KXX69366.1 hypothetical protein AVL50_19425 [Flammeovirga sp. SJP92]
MWSLFTDIKHFRSEKKIFLLLPVGLSIVFGSIVLIWNVQINTTFDKPTLVRIFYDGDYNGTGIDFKTDGSYIFNNSSLGLSEYRYGTYKINDNTIVIDKKNLEKVVLTNKLEIRTDTVAYLDHSVAHKYVYQIDKSGEILVNATIFRLIVDNRNKYFVINKKH